MTLLVTTIVLPGPSVGSSAPVVVLTLLRETAAPSLERSGNFEPSFVYADVAMRHRHAYTRGAASWNPPGSSSSGARFLMRRSLARGSSARSPG